MNDELVKEDVTVDELIELFQHLEKKPHPNLILDSRIATAFGWTHNCDTMKWGVAAPHWYFQNKSLGELMNEHGLKPTEARLPPFSSSVSVAVVLVPEGLCPIIDYRDNKVVLNSKDKDDPVIYETAIGVNPACSIVMCCLADKIKKMGGIIPN